MLKKALMVAGAEAFVAGAPSELGRVAEALPLRRSSRERTRG